MSPGQHKKRKTKQILLLVEQSYTNISKQILNQRYDILLTVQNQAAFQETLNAAAFKHGWPTKFIGCAIWQKAYRCGIEVMFTLLRVRTLSQFDTETTTLWCYHEEDCHNNTVAENKFRILLILMAKGRSATHINKTLRALCFTHTWKFFSLRIDVTFNSNLISGPKILEIKQNKKIDARSSWIEDNSRRGNGPSDRHWETRKTDDTWMMLYLAATLRQEFSAGHSKYWREHG